MLSSMLASWRTEMGKTKNKKLPENCFNFTRETSKQIQDDYRKWEHMKVSLGQSGFTRKIECFSD